MRKMLASVLMVVTLIILVGGVARVSEGVNLQSTKLFVDPPTYNATTLGEVFTININISNIQGLLGFGLKFGYNTTLLDVLTASTHTFYAPIGWWKTEGHESQGYVRLAANFTQPGEGNGTLAKITLNATYGESASCTFDLYDTILYDSGGGHITHDVEGGNYRFMTPRVTVATDKLVYSLGENIQIHGNLTIDGSSLQGLVALEVDDPRDRGIVFRTMQIGTPSPTNITILNLYSCDSGGTPKESFQRGASSLPYEFYANVTVRNNGAIAKNVTITLNTYDQDLTPLGVSRTSFLLLGQSSAFKLSHISIPEWASLGNGTVYANVFTDPPKDGGTSYCPEELDTFQITDSLQGGSAPEMQSLQSSGNYNLTLRIPPDASNGVYWVYVGAFYQGQSVLSDTVFGVNTIIVPDHYPIIQEAVNAATPTNNSILVRPGTYNEHVSVNKSVTLVGSEPSETIINGTGNGNVVTITANNVQISRFTIKNSGGSSPYSGILLNNSSDGVVRENIILENYNGVYVTNSSQENTIRDNTIVLNNGCGINIHSSNISSILDNTLSNNNYGICLNQSSYMTLKDNTLIDNTYNFGVFGDSILEFSHDIYTSNTVDGKPIIYWRNQYSRTVPANAGFVAIVSSTEIAARGLNLKQNGQGILLAFTTDSLIERVNTSHNGYGIYIFNSHRNTIIGGTSSNNSVGIYQKLGSENIICHNNFTENANQVQNYQSSNTWNDGAGKGNYWSDYTGQDDGSNNRTAGDGVGDTLLPHNGVDWYPIMNPWILVRDVAVTNVTFVLPCNETHLYPGWMIDVTATVQNEGDFTETFNVIAYYDNITFDLKTLTELAPLTETATNLTWDTEGVSPGSHTISVEASALPGETDKTDNTYIDGNVTLLVPTVHDLNVTSVTTSIPNNYSHVYSGWIINITVIIKNEGHYKEIPNVTAYYNETIISTKIIVLYPLASNTLNFTWDTAGVLSCGSYTVSANVSIVPEEMDTGDNMGVDGIISGGSWVTCQATD